MLKWLQRAIKPGGELVVVGAVEPIVQGAIGAGYHVTRLPDVAALSDQKSPTCVIFASGDEQTDLDAARKAAAGWQISGQQTIFAIAAETQAALTAIQDFDSETGNGLRVRPLSASQRMARRLLLDHPFGRLNYDAQAPQPVIFGTGAEAEQILLQLFRMMHLPGVKPRATIVGGERWLDALTSSLPALKEIGTLAATENWDGAASAIYVADAAIWNAQKHPDWFVPVYWLPCAGPAPAGTIAVLQTDWREAVAALFSDPADLQAQAIHELYLEERRQAGHTIGIRPSMQPWDALPERFRAASRHQADHIACKLAAISCHIVPADGGPRFAFTTEEREALAEMEHQRWAAVQMLDGWRYGETRDDAAKLTPLLVPYESLTPEIRDLDRLSVRAIPAQLDRVKQTILRDLTLALHGGGAPQSGFDTGFPYLLDDLTKRYPERVLVLRTALASPVQRRAAEIALAKAKLSVIVQPNENLPPEAIALAGRAETILVSSAAAADFVIQIGSATSQSAARIIELDLNGALRRAPWQ
ncbi:MAG TPA: RyR domain-containing protein [Rhizomicrobium sp.]|nr:RyR domain-containing protein [Rhizomicrobium sp.]